MPMTNQRNAHAYCASCHFTADGARRPASLDAEIHREVSGHDVHLVDIVEDAMPAPARPRHLRVVRAAGARAGGRG